jgi:hypothetical protein
MSLIGTNRTWRDVRSESAFGGKAEVGFRGRQVGFWHETDLPRCPQFGRYRGESGRSRVSSAMQLVVVSFPPKLHVLHSLANTAH